MNMKWQANGNVPAQVVSSDEFSLPSVFRAAHQDALLHVGHFRPLAQELTCKRSVPGVIVIYVFMEDLARSAKREERDWVKES